MPETSSLPLILAIEDDAAIRTVYTELLEDEGYRCVTWASVHTEDLAAIRDLAPDLIILDLLMGGQALGWHFLRELYLSPSQEIPILVVSAAGGLAKEHMAAIEEWGCGFLGKPFDLDHLLNAVKQCLSDKCDEVLSQV